MVVHSSLCLESATLDLLTARSLANSFNYRLGLLELFDVAIEITYTELSRLVRNLAVNSLRLTDCRLDDAQTVGDELFSKNPQLRSVIIEFDECTRSVTFSVIT